MVESQKLFAVFVYELLPFWFVTKKLVVRRPTVQFICWNYGQFNLFFVVRNYDLVSIVIIFNCLVLFLFFLSIQTIFKCAISNSLVFGCLIV